MLRNRIDKPTCINTRVILNFGNQFCDATPALQIHVYLPSSALRIPSICCETLKESFLKYLQNSPLTIEIRVDENLHFYFTSSRFTTVLIFCLAICFASISILLFHRIAFYRADKVTAHRAKFISPQLQEKDQLDGSTILSNGKPVCSV